MIVLDLNFNMGQIYILKYQASEKILNNETQTHNIYFLNNELY